MRLARVLAQPWRLSAVVSAALFLGTACAERAPLDVLDPAGTPARKADFLWDVTFAVAVVVFFLVEGALVFALIRYRRRPGREPARFHGNTRAEVILTVIPALILAVVGVLTVRTILDLARQPTNALDVTVTAQQFWWEFQYPEQDLVTANELHIPTDTPIHLRLVGAPQNRVDPQPEVIHSFWVARLGGTQDMVPGRETFVTIEADEPGTYFGQCKEYCGLGHAYMRLRVIAHEPSAFESWVRDHEQRRGEPATAAAEGARLFSEGRFREGLNCASCHAVQASPIDEAVPDTGPNLANFANRKTLAAGFLENNEQNLAAWLRDPPAVKPGAKMPDLGLSEDQIRALVAYLRTLK